MKQSNFVRGEKYRLVRMQYKGMPELNGTEVILTGIKKGKPKRPVQPWDSPGRGPRHYKLSNGMKVLGCNLERVEDK
ncbi:hypothetical protein AGMMS50268_03870 [Spirochaetia bacterium]|nr:hypothetical protein AGMMS50268_03870 [Spirochaetia bacterium]